MNTSTATPPLAVPAPKKTFDFNLEALRGVAALVVVWGHLTIEHGALDPGYYPTGVWSYVGPAHLAVLLFFLLSGYVIGLNHKTSLTVATTPAYLRKRFIRIYPIYLACLGLSLLVANQPYPPATILSHLVMTQGLTAPVIPEFSPSWSLTYEVVFYLLFIPVSILRIPALLVIVICVAVGCADACLYPGHGFALLPSFAFGAAFWFVGLAIAQYQPVKHTSYGLMLSCLFLIMAIGKLDAPVTAFYQVGVYLIHKDLSALPVENQPGSIAFRDFGYLPYCILVVLVFASKRLPFQQAIMTLLLLLPLPTFYYYRTHLPATEWATLTLPIIFYVLAVVLFLLQKQTAKLCEQCIKKLIPTGSISYGVYIIHFPLLYLFARIAPLTGSPLTFLLRLVVFLLLAVGGAYLLEKQFQPWIKDKLS